MRRFGTPSESARLVRGPSNSRLTAESGVPGLLARSALAPRCASFLRSRSLLSFWIDFVGLGHRQVLPVVDSFDSALELEAAMFRVRQSPEYAGGALDGKMEACAGPDEVDCCAVEGSDAALLPVLDGAIGSCHRLMRRSDRNRISRGGRPRLKAASA